MTSASPSWSVTPQGSQVLEHLAREHRRTLTLADDRDWLRAITPRPAQLLKRMADAGALHRLGRGRYVVGAPGAVTPKQVLRTEALAAGRLRGLSDYYVGFLSAFIDYQLIDGQSRTVTVAVPQDDARVEEIRAADVRITRIRLTRRFWPTEDEIERVWAERGSMDHYMRSTLERTLVDGLLRPDRCGGIETVVAGWARARRRPDVDWLRVADIAHRIGGSAARRTSLLLSRLGLEQAAERALGDLGSRGVTVLFDRSQDYGDVSSGRDARTGVVVNLPAGYLSGWLSAAEVT